MAGRVIQHGSNFSLYHRNANGLFIDNTSNNLISPEQRRKIFITNDEWEVLLRAIALRGTKLGSVLTRIELENIKEDGTLDQTIKTPLDPNLRAAIIGVLQHEGSI